jgi:hypothetical protein
VGVDIRELGVAEELGSASFWTSSVTEGECLIVGDMKNPLSKDITVDGSSGAVAAVRNEDFGGMLALGVSSSVDSSSSPTRSTTVDAFVEGSDALPAGANDAA